MENNRIAGSREKELVWAALDNFRIEIPSWGFANTGTRFGKFVQSAAATNIEEKFADAGEVNRLTGASPTIALHVQWDLPNGLSDIKMIQALERQHGIRAGSINPNFFQSQIYKHGSLANPDAGVRRHAIEHLVLSVEIGKALSSKDVSIWLSDGSNYAGTQSMRKRIAWVEEALGAAHDATGENQRLLVEYKPFEPAFYHTDIADWGMALHFARSAGPRAKVLVDTGHHYQGVNIEQIVAWLLHLDALGGFHFNDRKYADDDLTLGSVDPYAVFRIFHEILSAPENVTSQIAYMIDQSHNLKGKVEAMVQSVVTAQELYARAALVDGERLADLQDACKLVEAEECFRNSFWTDVRPLVRAWREARNFPVDPLQELEQSGYVQRIEGQRAARNEGAVATYA